MLRPAAILIALAATAYADVSLPGGGNGFDLERAFRGPVGAWQEFMVQSTTMPSVRLTARYAVVRKSERGFTLEMVNTVEGNGQATLSPVVYQTEYRREGKGWHVVRVRTNAGGHISDIQVPPDTKAPAPPQPIGDQEADVTTPAGTFHCRHYRQDKEELWLTTSLPLFGLVKMTSPDATLTLRGYGTNAHPSFD